MIPFAFYNGSLVAMIVSLIMSIFRTYMSTKCISSLPVHNYGVTCFARIGKITDITYVPTHTRHIFIYPAVFKNWGKKKKSLAGSSFHSVFVTSSNCTFTSLHHIFLHCFKTSKIFFFIICIAVIPKCHHDLIDGKVSKNIFKNTGKMGSSPVLVSLWN